MRNLKRALSLALAAIMLLGMMVVGAGAVNLDEFSDKEDIANKDAVSLLTTLGIINGKEDGSFFDPNGNVTRAEMAKMISVILNKGTDNNDLYVGAASSLTDVKGHWAEGHINYCSSLGIIAGRGDGTFDPGATVTASEAAKMLLVAVGYNAEIERFVGGDWAVNVNAKASALGIFNGFGKNVTAPLNRDDAALLIYNALDVERIQQYSGNYALVYSDRRTVLGEMYGVYKVKAVVTGNEWARLEDTDYDERLADGKTRIANPRIYTSNTLGTNTGDSTTANNNQADIILGNTRIFDVSTPVDYLGQTVTMYVRKTTVLNDYEVLGVYLREEDNTVKFTAEQTEDTLKDFLKGTGLTVDGDTLYYVNYGKVASPTAANAILTLNDTGVKNFDKISVDGKDTKNSYGVEMTVIDNDKDGTVDYVLWLQEDLTQLATVSEKKDTVAFLSDTSKDLTSYNKGKAIDRDDVVFVDDAEEGDIVLVRTYGGRYYVSQPEVISGEMEAYSASKTDNLYIKVNGETYRPSFIETTAGDNVDELYTFDVDECDPKTGERGVEWDIAYDFYLDSNGHVAAFKPTEKSVSNYALILESGYNPGVYDTDASGKITVLLADGTEATYELNFASSAANLGKQIANLLNGDTEHYTRKAGVQELKGFLGTDYTDNSHSRPWSTDASDKETDFPYVFADVNNVIDETAARTATVDGQTVTATSAAIGASNAQRNAVDYRAGKAAGYVITYTLNSEEKLTINSVIGAAHKDGDYVMPGNVLGCYGAGALSAKYSSGEGKLVHAGSNNKNDVVANREQTAVDEDTVAFYYWKDGNEWKSASAIGYTNMASVDIGESFLTDNVRKTNLASLALFNAKGKEATKHYVYILNPNDRYGSGKYIDLYGILEDGKAITLKVERDNFEDMELDEKDEKYGKVFQYSTDKDGITTLSQPAAGRVRVGYAMNLTNQTVAFDTSADDLSKKDYEISYSYKGANIWDVTEAEAGEDGRKGNFNDTRIKNVILVLNSDVNKVVTAYVWNLDEDEDVELNTDAQVIVSDEAHDYLNPMFYVEDGHALTNGEMRAALAAEMKRDGCTDITWGGGTVSFTDRSGNVVSGKTVNFTQVYKITIGDKVGYFKVGDKIKNSGSATPVSGTVRDIVGEYYYVDEVSGTPNGKTTEYVVAAADATILDGYYKVDLQTAIAITDIDNVTITAELNGKPVGMGTSDNVYYVNKDVESTLVVTVASKGAGLKVTKNTTGIIAAIAGVTAEVTKTGNKAEATAPATASVLPTVDTTDTFKVNFKASVEQDTTYTGFEMTFTFTGKWSVDKNNDDFALTKTDIADAT